MGLSRGVSAGGAAALLAMTSLASGCRSFDCNDTATCAVVGDDVVTANDGAPDEASDDVVATNDPGAEATDDVAALPDPAVPPTDDAGDPHDAGSDTSDPLADATDARPPMEAAMADVYVGQDALSEAANDGALKCVSNVLTPVTAVASSMTGRLTGWAIDGNFATRWESAWGVDPQWIYLDFGAKVFVDRVQIAWQHSCAANYDLQISNDGATWVTMRSIVGNATGQAAPPADWTTAVDHQSLIGFGRYMRVNGTARCSTLYGYSMWEMRVFGDRNASCSP